MLRSNLDLPIIRSLIFYNILGLFVLVFVINELNSFDPNNVYNIKQIFLLVHITTSMMSPNLFIYLFVYLFIFI